MLTRLTHKLTTFALVLCALTLCSLSALAQDPNDLRPGSVLFFGRYTSSAANPASEDTQINITNTNQNTGVAVHLFLIDGATCSVADSFVFLTQSQTGYFLASDFDPGIRGHIIAVATDGKPTQHNFLLGVAFIRESNGQFAEIPAVAVNKRVAGEVDDGPDATASMVFDGGNTANSYDRLPAMVAVSAFNSQVTDTTTVAMYYPPANLLIGDNSTISLFGLMYNDLEASRSFTTRIGCYTQFALTSLRILNGINTFIPRGSTGWVKFSGSRPLLGVVLNRGPLSNGGRNLSVLSLFPSYTITVPAF